jgi:hypothetical protein
MALAFCLVLWFQAVVSAGASCGLNPTDMRTCGAKCASDADQLVTCSTQCLTSLGYVDDCATCRANQVACGFSNCITPCSAETPGADCTACIESKCQSCSTIQALSAPASTPTDSATAASESTQATAASGTAGAATLPLPASSQGSGEAAAAVPAASDDKAGAKSTSASSDVEEKRFMSVIFFLVLGVSALY